MPRRTISIGRQPATFNFQDDAGPLVNGLAYAMSQFLGAGKDKALIENQMQQQNLSNGRADRALDLQEAALGLRPSAATANASAMKTPGAIPSHVLGNMNDVVDTRAMQDGLVDPVLDASGMPNGRYAPKAGANPEDISALERLRKSVFLDSGVDPMTLTPTPSGKWESPSPEVADELARVNAQNEIERKQLGVTSGDTNAPAEQAMALQEAALGMGANPAAPAAGMLTTPMQGETPEQKQVRLQKETGYPDGQSNWYNPRDWLRSGTGQQPSEELYAGYQAAGYPQDVADALAAQGTTAESVNSWAEALSGTAKIGANGQAVTDNSSYMNEAAQKLLLMKVNEPDDYASLTKALRWLDTQGVK